MLGCSVGLLAESQISFVTCCSHWHSTCVTYNLGACLCPMCPHSSVPLDCATLVTRIPASSFLLLLFVSYVILAGKQQEFNAKWNKIQENKMETSLECVCVVGACVLLSPGCSVQLEWPCQKPGLAFGMGQVHASRMFFLGLGSTVAGCAGSRAAACASLSPCSPASAAPRLVESTGWCDSPVSPTPSCRTTVRELGEEAQGCLTSTPGLLPFQAQPCISQTNLAQTAVRLHIPFNLWLGVINPPTKHPGIPVSVTPQEWSSFPSDRLVIDAAAAKRQQGCHSTHPFCRNSAFVLLLSLSTSILQEFSFCAGSATQHIHSAEILPLCWFCVTDRAGLRLPGLFTARKVQLLGLRRKGGWRKRQQTLSRRAHAPLLLCCSH